MQGIQDEKAVQFACEGKGLSRQMGMFIVIQLVQLVTIYVGGCECAPCIKLLGDTAGHCFNLLTSRLQTDAVCKLQYCYLESIRFTRAMLYTLQTIGTEPASDKPSLTKVVGTLKRAVEVRSHDRCWQQQVCCLKPDHPSHVI